MEKLSIIQSIILGIVQGLSEFLPISSSGHLIVTRDILHFPDPGKTYDVILHMGTLIALIIYFREDLWNIAKGTLADFKNKKFYGSLQTNLFWFLVISTIPGGLFGALFQEKLEAIKSPYIISSLLIFFGILLFWGDRTGKKTKEIEVLTWQNALLIGCAQALALFPGVSRSGISITAALLIGFSREASARYSFLISIPLIGGISVYKIFSLIKNGMDSNGLLIYAIGLIASLISGFLCIKYLMDYLKKGTFTIFVVYRVLLGISLIILALVGYIK